MRPRGIFLCFRFHLHNFCCATSDHSSEFQSALIAFGLELLFNRPP